MSLLRQRGHAYPPQVLANLACALAQASSRVAIPEFKFIVMIFMFFFEKADCHTESERLSEQLTVAE